VIERVAAALDGVSMALREMTTLSVIEVNDVVVEVWGEPIKHEHAEEISDGDFIHSEGKAGSPVVAV
jgi:hypothetical protein